MVTLSDGSKVKEEYYNRIESIVSDGEVSAEDALMFIYQIFDDCKNIYEDRNRILYYTKIQFIDAFEKMYEQMGTAVFELTTHEYIRVVSALFNDFDLDIIDFLDELSNDKVWDALSMP